VLDPFSGTATAGVAALRHGRRYLGIELNEDYPTSSKERLKQLNGSDLAIARQ